jgi:hypothetical protein
VVFSSPGQRPCEFLPLLGHLAYVHNPILYTYLNLLLGKHCGILSHTWLWWLPFKVVPYNLAFNSRWQMLLKLEISLNWPLPLNLSFSWFNCGCMIISSPTCLQCFPVNFFFLSINTDYANKAYFDHIKIFSSEIIDPNDMKLDNWNFNFNLIYIYIYVLTFSIKFRSQIENQLSD